MASKNTKLPKEFLDEEAEELDDTFDGSDDEMDEDLDQGHDHEHESSMDSTPVTQFFGSFDFEALLATLLCEPCSCSHRTHLEGQGASRLGA